ncbi:MAG: NosD domain-containing protein [Acidimicrobiia bacterium]
MNSAGALVDGSTVAGGGEQGSISGPPPPVDRAHWALGTLAALLVVASVFLPIWRSNLDAPQYPNGLHFLAYGNRVEGDLAEIDSLNHYVGMRPFRTDDLPEMALWPLGIAAALAAVVVATVARRRRLLARLARLYLWVLPISILAVIQVRLYQFGHDLDPAAAFRMDGFTPLVIGRTKIWNFTAFSRPGSAILCMLTAAAALSFGPRVVRRRKGRGTRAFPTLLAVILAVGALAPTARANDDWIDLESLIAAVPEGGTLILSDQTYRGNVTIDRRLTIEGEGMPLVQGNGSGTVITITATGTVLRGLRVAGSGPGPSGSPAGIRVEADDVHIEGVTVEDSYVGIAVHGAARVHLVGNHVIGRSGGVVGEDHALGGDETLGGGRGDGLSLWDVDGALIRGNVIERVRDGVFVSFGSGALIDGNELRHNRYGVHSMFAAHLTLVENLIEGNLSAAVLMYGGPALVLRNRLTDSGSASTGFGLLLKDVADVQVVENVITRNRTGLHIDGPAGGEEPIRITANTVIRNQIGVALYPASTAVFLANSFVGNVVQVLQQGRGASDGVAWHDRGHGNHWGTYRGYDNGRGKGATPHVEGSSVERLLVRAPVLLPLASSPAFRMIRAVEERWALQRPVLVDPLPLIRPISPSPDSPPPEARAGLFLGGTGASAALLAAMALISLAKRPRLTRARR